MRHLNSGSKLGKQPAHRRAVCERWSPICLNTGGSLTTLTRAKRPSCAEKMITLGKARHVASRRQAASYIMLACRHPEAVQRDRAQICRSRRRLHALIHAGNRVGDNAKVAILEIVGYEFKLKGKTGKPKKEEAVEGRAKPVLIAP